MYLNKMKGINFMIKFYLKIQNNMITKNLLYIVTFLVLMFNVIIRIFPRKFINISRANSSVKMIPYNLYTYCDVYLLILFIVILFFFLGTDLKNSMEEITLAIGGSSINKFMLRKLISILSLYIVLYLISFVNIYTLHIKLANHNNIFIPLKEIIFYSVTTNIFIISLSLFILFLSRDIAVSTTIITAYYLIEEALWRCKVTQGKGILGHLYQYYDYQSGELLKVKIIYIIVSSILLFFTYRMIRYSGSSFRHRKVR